jgi:Timeless protein
MLPPSPAACLKDLQRFLRREDENPEKRDVTLKLGELRLVETDLIPLLLAHPSDEQLVINIGASVLQCCSGSLAAVILWLWWQVLLLCCACVLCL